MRRPGQGRMRPCRPRRMRRGSLLLLLGDLRCQPPQPAEEWAERKLAEQFKGLQPPAAEQPVARVADLPAIVGTLRGKVEFEVSEEGREEEVLAHLLRRAIAETFRARLGSADLTPLLAKFDSGQTVETGELISASDLLQRVGEVPGLAKIMERLGMDGGESFGHAAAAIEFALEGLYLMRRLSKDTMDGTAVYRT